ncbi:MAG: hypothetical protein ABI927_01310 [Gaiellaceae bacterium]
MRQQGDLVGEVSDVVAWRREQLAASGFSPGLGAALAGDWRVDLHALLQLVDRGCPPELAARILSPLDGEQRPC